MKKSLYCLVTLLFLSFTFFAQNSEHIQSFDVEIVLNKDRSIQVIENIKVTALGEKIKRGITRSLPTYRSINGQKFNTKYKNVQILRDGQKEPFIKERIDDYLVYYIGKKDVFLEPGTYNYTLTYEVPNQIMVGSNGIQLRWNAIGNDVIFSSKEANITLNASEEIGLKDAKMYLGEYRSDEDQSRVNTIKNDNKIMFSIPDGLLPKEAATVEINLNEGSVDTPTFFEKKSSLLTLALGGLAMLFYFVITWMKYGIDPKPKSSDLLYDVPENMSPASINYIFYERSQSRALTSSFIDLSVKGYVEIAEKGESGLFSSKVFTIHKLKEKTNDLPQEQYRLMQHLFASGATIYLDGEYNSIVKKAIRAHQNAIASQHQDFVKQGNNLVFVFFPILILLFVLVTSSILANTIEINSYPHFSNLAWFIPISIASLLLYRYLIIQPTVEKLNLQGEIGALKKYIAMKISEVTQLDDPPARDIEHFESLLPYAYALGVESNWSDSFSKLLDDSKYAPSWNGGYLPSSNFHQGFSRGISSAGTKPQPSSGSGGGGGGFSGGGGGGGGVGGW